MLFYSIKMPHPRWITVVALLLCLICVLFLVFKVIPYLTATRQTVSEGVIVRSEADLVSFLESYGYRVSEQPIETAEVTIPETFDAVYQNYEALQQQAGFSLEPYRGKTVQRYTFLVSNHARSAQEEVRANLLVYEQTLIGGDLCSVALDGFMSPLEKNLAQ